MHISDCKNADQHTPQPKTYLAVNKSPHYGLQTYLFPCQHYIKHQEIQTCLQYDMNEILSSLHKLFMETSFSTEKEAEHLLRLLCWQWSLRVTLHLRQRLEFGFKCSPTAWLEWRDGWMDAQKKINKTNQEFLNLSLLLLYGKKDKNQPRVLGNSWCLSHYSVASVVLSSLWNLLRQNTSSGQNTGKGFCSSGRIRVKILQENDSQQSITFNIIRN